MPSLPRPEDAGPWLECLAPAQQQTFLEGCGLYWAGPAKVDLKNHDLWRRTLANQLIVASAQAILANLLDPSNLTRLPWPSVAEWIGPFPAGEVWTIGARPGGGKTTFLLNWINHLYAQGTPFTLMPLESGADEVFRKLAALRTAIPYAGIVNGEASTEDYDRLSSEINALAEGFIKLGVLSCPDRRLNLTNLDLAMSRAASLGHQLVIVDHLHRLEVVGREQEALAGLMRHAKDTAYRLDLTVVFTCQLNRADSTRLAPFRPPKLSDFRGSATIEQESDVVGGLWRPLKPMGAKVARLLENGDREVREYITPHRMAFVCLKHRRDERAFMRQSRLYVEHGVIRDLSPGEKFDDDNPNGFRPQPPPLPVPQRSLFDSSNAREP